MSQSPFFLKPKDVSIENITYNIPKQSMSSKNTKYIGINYRDLSSELIPFFCQTQILWFYLFKY